jgi:hypothetical protein
MAESSVKKRSPIVEQLLKNPLPQHEPEVEEAMDSFQEGRSRSRATTMLDLRMLDGSIESFAYAYLTRVQFKPEDTIAMRFGKDEVRVSGRNLYRLFETITEQRTRFIQEGAEGEEGLKPVDAAHVDQIEIVEGDEP